MRGPERERSPLTRKEKATWIRAVVAEARRDQVGLTCQKRLVELMDAAAERGGLCDHEECRATRDAGLDEVQAYLWNPPR
ncbi:hypothetical protein SEA_ARACELI_52 [Streptomyces phage Araceli]|nr:hypothetical protein SEA_HENOCCUS_53 [Streptomyces phage Henoccus]AWY07371.1 hypothetical protein SEA_JACKIEB_53 [Streptomyces phage JackieB]QFG07866.1 hypothetical protein SEA_ARACELI_52 [Streptomyces phage Araceli]